MEATTNISAIVEAKGGKAAGKLTLPAMLELPGAEPLSFEQLLGDLAAQLGTQPGAALPGAESAPDAEEAATDATNAAVDLLPIAGAPPVSDAPAPTTMLQIWQAWLANAPNTSVPVPQASTALQADPDAVLAEPGAAVSRPQGRGPSVGDAREASTQELSGARGESDTMEFQLPQSTAARPVLATQERDIETRGLELNAAASKEVHASLALTQPEARKAAQPQPVQMMNIAVPLRAPEWSNAFSDQVVLLVNDGGTRAELRLNPAELGPIDVSLDVQDDRVHASFTIHHAATLDAVQAALPKLEQMLAERGVQLDRVSVESNERRQDQQSQQARDGHGGGGNGRGGREPDKGAPQASERLLRRNGTVDTFA